MALDALILCRASLLGSGKGGWKVMLRSIICRSGTRKKTCRWAAAQGIRTNLCMDQGRRIAEQGRAPCGWAAGQGTGTGCLHAARVRFPRKTASKLCPREHCYEGAHRISNAWKNLVFQGSAWLLLLAHQGDSYDDAACCQATPVRALQMDSECAAGGALAAGAQLMLSTGSTLLGDAALDGLQALMHRRSSPTESSAGG